jgi:hypothetical protein
MAVRHGATLETRESPAAELFRALRSHIHEQEAAGNRLG